MSNMYWNKVKRINRELNCYYSVSLFFFILSRSHFINLDQEGSLFFYWLFALSSNSFVQLVSQQWSRYAGRLCCCLLQICRVFAGWTVISAARRRCLLVLCHAVSDMTSHANTVWLILLQAYCSIKAFVLFKDLFECYISSTEDSIFIWFM